MYRQSAIENISQNLYERTQLPIQEGLDPSKIQYLLRTGLAVDRGKFNLYQKALQNPQAGVASTATRHFVASSFETIMGMIFSDSQLWNRLKTLLLRNHQKSLKNLSEDISEDGLRALVKKSVEHEVPLETIFEVYSRGAQGGNTDAGFNRVNSFIAGGKARQMDADLLGETVIKQPVQEKDNTLSVVRRVLSESKRRK